MPINVTIGSDNDVDKQSGDGFNNVGVIKYNVYIPAHNEREDTSLYIKTRKLLIVRDKTCFMCQRNASQCASPLEAHHHPIMRSMTNMVDWDRFIKQAQAGAWGTNIQKFNWDKFNKNEPYTFVDNMLFNGMLLCKDHHRGVNTGIHVLPYPLFIAQAFAKEGYKFSDNVVIDHGDDNISVTVKTITS